METEKNPVEQPAAIETTETKKELVVMETKQLTTTIEKTLNQLETEIKEHLTKTAINYIEVGNRLIKAKELVEHGQWQAWLENNFQLRRQSAQNFMNIATRFGKNLKDKENSQPIGNLNSTQMIAMLALPKGQEEDFIEQKITDGTPVEKMSIRNLKKEIEQWNTTHKKKKKKKSSTNENTIDIDSNISNEAPNTDQQDAKIENQTENETNTYLLLEQFLSLGSNLANIPNLNELAQKYAENNPDKFTIEIEHLYSIIDIISPRQSK